VRQRPRSNVPVSLVTLEKSALFRLERSSLSEKQLRDGLKRKCMRQERAIDEEVRAWIDEVVAKMKRLGFIDDERTAAARARSLRATGTSARGAVMKLKQKGIDGALASRVLAAVDEEPRASGAPGAELAAAREYVRRRKLTSKDPQKALAALARRGFSYDVAKKALAAQDD
jgi:regulatory protein